MELRPRWSGALLMTACLSVGVLLAGCSNGDTPGPSEEDARRTSPIPESVRQELVQLGDDDQAIRRDLTPDRMQDTIFAKQMLRGDSARAARLRTIVETYGWPDPDRAGREAANASFLILQHSPDQAFQAEMLPTIQELAERGAIPPDQAALLVDRVLVQQGRPQRYGTQFSVVDGRLRMDSVADPAGLDERRALMGLVPIDEYMRVLAEVYEAEVGRQDP